MERAKTDVSLRVWSILAVLLAFLPNLASPDVRGARSGDELALSLRYNVVRVVAQWENGETHEGFGIIVGERSGQLYVATANHEMRGKFPNEIATSVETEFYGRRGEIYPATLLGTSDTSHDLAVVRVSLPHGLSLRWEILSPDPARRGMPVWFVGRSGTWYVPSNAGTVNEIRLDDRIVVDNLKVQPGTSGAPLIAENGIVGMIVTDAPGEESQALTIDVIKRAFEIWGHPWQLTKLEQPPPDITGTYTGPGVIVASNCSNESDNGTGNYLAVVNISSQSGGKFSSDLILRDPYLGYEIAVDLAGTVTAGAELHGRVEYQVFMHGAPVSRGKGTFTGQVIDDVLSLRANVQDTFGDTCTAGVSVTARR